MEYKHLPLSLVGRTDLSLSQLRCSVQRNVSNALLAALTPLMLGGAIAPAAILLPSQPVQAQSISNLIINRSLKLGDRGADVLQLQRALVQRGLLNISIPRNAQVGYFGPATKAALQDYQRSERDLRADGVLGEATFLRLFAVGLTPTRTYSIALMQAQLSELGYYSSRVDGEFGPVTERALLDLRDENFVALDARETRLDNTFDVVSGYYEQQRQRQDLPHPEVLESRVERQLPKDKLFGFSGFGNAVAVAPAAGSDNIYRTIVPLDRADAQAELSSLRLFVGSAFLSEDSRGTYAQVGSYSGRQNAEEMVTFLRSKGFDARVIYN